MASASFYFHNSPSNKFIHTDFRQKIFFIAINKFPFVVLFIPIIFFFNINLWFISQDYLCSFGRFTSYIKIVCAGLRALLPWKCFVTAIKKANDTSNSLFFSSFYYHVGNKNYYYIVHGMAVLSPRCAVKRLYLISIY